jgi:hypothetical protein
MTHIKVSFEQTTLRIPVDHIIPSRTQKDQLRRTSKYQAILSSIREIGIIEPLAVFPQKSAGPDSKASFLLLDGHLRLDALKELGAETALCLISKDDESFTYNRQVNRLSTIQEHFMIRRAIDRGVSSEKIAKALNIDIRRIHERERLLDGIAPEAVKLLKDRHLGRGIFGILRKMKPLRQIEAAEMMISANIFTQPYAQMILVATRPEQLVEERSRNHSTTVSLEDIARMERELEKVNQDYKAAEESLGENMLLLVVAKGYISRLLENKTIAEYLRNNYRDLATEMRGIIEAVTSDARSVGRE